LWKKGDVMRNHEIENFAKKILKLESILILKSLVLEYGIDVALVYGELLNRNTYYSKFNKLEDDSYFFLTIEELQNSTGMSAFQQRKAIQTLEENGFIITKRKGLPPKRYFKVIANDEIFNMIS
jgi:biotin operon repressor